MSIGERIEYRFVVCQSSEDAWEGVELLLSALDRSMVSHIPFANPSRI